jgi:hypothetical protein
LLFQQLILKDIHEGICGHHVSSRAITSKAFRAVFYSLSAIEDAKNIVRTCEACQRFAFKPHAPAAGLMPIPLAWPFAQWGLDMVGKLHLNLEQLNLGRGSRRTKRSQVARVPPWAGAALPLFLLELPHPPVFISELNSWLKNAYKKVPRRVLRCGSAENRKGGRTSEDWRAWAAPGWSRFSNIISISTMMKRE